MLSDIVTIQEDFDKLEQYYRDPENELRWHLVFTLPGWLKIWWQHFGTGYQLYLKSVRLDGQIVGIAPLKIENDTASFIGSINVCDYLDFITSPGKEKTFLKALLDDLTSNGIKRLKLESFRPDSITNRHLLPLAEEKNLKFTVQPLDVSLDMELPGTWEEYLIKLDRKQRHEIRRKIRNLSEVGEVTYTVSTNNEALMTFLDLFPESRKDKAAFMTPEMRSFFQSITQTFSNTGIVRFGSLKLDGITVAMVMYFDYDNNVYLYNSAYSPDYRNLSVGIISKVKSIENSILEHKRRYDFLKGSEQYKYYLGGQEIPLYSSEIVLE
ncbi:MAG: GNAT family N-acetyltransferase [Dehalococcoidales bacterium]|nr:GNAT family N-acetyltransferase [Dehalococcoidales bacterium]